MHNIIDKVLGIDLAGEMSPEASSIVRSFDSPNSPIEEFDIEQARREHSLAEHDIELSEPVSTVSEKTIPHGTRDVRIRIYTPEGEGPFPLFIYAHGGCWVFCSLDSHDKICHYFSQQARCIVISVDYALAPEHPFPSGLDDLYQATLWCMEHAASLHGDPQKIAIGGDSAGGNLATVVAQMLPASKKKQLCLQVLIYPICEVLSQASSSLERYAENYFFTKEILDWTSHLYLKDNSESSEANPLVSPIHGDVPEPLAPAFFVIAECDILRDQGLAYARKLAQTGTSVRCHYYLGMPHAFLAMAGSLPLGRQAMDDCVKRLTESFLLQP